MRILLCFVLLINILALKNANAMKSEEFINKSSKIIIKNVNKKINPQKLPNSFYVQAHKNPQPGILPPPESLTGIAIAHLKSGFDVQKVGCAIGECPSAWNPPYSPENYINPVSMDFPPPTDKKLQQQSAYTYCVNLSNDYFATRLYANFGIGTHLLEKFFPNREPKNSKKFKEMVSKDGEHRFPSTGGDLLLHVKSSELALIYDAIDYFKVVLSDQVERIDSTICFTPSNGRNQFGFFDATSDPKTTANPTQDIGPIVQSYPYTEDEYKKNPAPGCPEETSESKRKSCQEGLYVDLGKIATSFIGEEDPEHFNGSFCIVQKFINDLQKFNSLSEEDQNKVFGRKKKTGEFITSQSSPLDGGINRDYPNAHMVRTHIRQTGPYGEANMDPCIQNIPGASLAPLQIYRQAASFVEGSDKGLLFIAYSRYCDTFDKMLSRMIGESVTWPGSKHEVDALLNFAAAKTGQYFYMPNLKELTSLSNFPIIENK